MANAGSASSPGQDENELDQFRLHGVQDTGRTLGHGSYAVVKELEYQGRKCAGKKIHQLLFESASAQEKEEILKRFASECRLLGGLTHPCLVQFLGVHWERGSRLPFLVMEFLPHTLSDYIEKYGAVLGESVRYSILHDVAQGLRYLHDLKVVHRDLSANNALLTANMRAKISDLGVAKIINISPEQMTRRTSTQAPGTPCYMPPEALVAKPRYTSKLDIFSYGVLVVHVLCGQWPFPSDAFQPDPSDPDAMVPVQEVDRRMEYLQQIGESHPLMHLIRRCLHNSPSKRPEAAEVLEQIFPLVPLTPAQGGSDTTIAKLTEKVQTALKAHSQMASSSQAKAHEQLEGERADEMSVSGEKLGVAGSSTMWFHRSIGRLETERLIDNKDDGSFLIRESDTVKGAYVLSTIYQHRIYHYRIIPNESGKLSIQGQPGTARKLFSTLDELVDYYAHPNHGLVCALTRPIASHKDEDTPDEQEESGSLTQMELSSHLDALTSSSEQDHEEEVTFEVKTGKKTQTVTVHIKEGKLSFKKQGESHSSLYSHQHVLQMIKSQSNEAVLEILMEGQSRKDYTFASMQAREHFCQLIQLIRNRMRATMDLDSVSIFVGTWNMGDQSPPQDISSWFCSVGLGKTLPQALDKPHDIYAVGTQECSISEKEWLSKIRFTLKGCYDINYEKVASQTLRGIRLIILAKPEHVNKISHVQSSQVRTGFVGNILGDKGAVGISFFYGSASLCFINAYLTPGVENCHRRNQNYFDILKGMGALKQQRLNQFYLTNQFHHLFFFGDLNYRVDLGATEIVECAKKAEYSAIYVEDQLHKDKEKKKIFVGFDEAPILFPPTYNFTRGRRTLDDYVWVQQLRSGIRINVPSYCDRVLWSSYPGTTITNSSYGACNDIMTSHHSPLFASFEVGGVRQYAPKTWHGVGGGNDNMFIIVDSLKAKIQTSSTTYFYMEMYSLCFEGARKSGPNNEWMDTQAGYVWPVWCGRDYVAKLRPIVTELEYLEQQHLLIQLKSLESDESYAECCLSLRGLFSPKPVNVGKTLIHQGLEVGKLDAYIHVTLDQYRKPEDELYSDMNFLVKQSDLDGGRMQGRLGTGHNSEATDIDKRPRLPTPPSSGHHGRDLELPPPLPSRSPEPLSLPHQAEKRPSSVEDLLAVHGLSQYTQRLVENGYNDIYYIADITDWELEEIGVTQYSERQRLLKIFSGYRS